MATRLTGMTAIELAEKNGWLLSKRSEEPLGEGARDGLSPAEAREIALRDPSLVYVEVDEDVEGGTRLA